MKDSSSTLNQKVKELPELAMVSAGLDTDLFVFWIYVKFTICLAVLGIVFKGLFEIVCIIQSLVKRPKSEGKPALCFLTCLTLIVKTNPL